MPNVPGYTTIANVYGAFGGIVQTPGYVDMATLTPESFLASVPYIDAVGQFNANPNDTVDGTDSTIAIQDALNAADSSPETPLVFLRPTGNNGYVTGTNGVGLLIQGDGTGLVGAGKAGSVVNAATLIVGASSYAGPLITVQSRNGIKPVVGATVANLALASAASTPVATGISCFAPVKCGFYSNAYDATLYNGFLTAASTLSNNSGYQSQFFQQTFQVPALAGAKAIGYGTITNTSVNTSNVNFDFWFGTLINMSGGPSAGNNYGCYMGICDDIFFDYIQFLDVGSNCLRIAFDYALYVGGGTIPAASFPSDCMWEHADFFALGGGQVMGNRATTPGSNAYPHYIGHITQENGSVNAFPGSFTVAENVIASWGVGPGVITTPAVPATGTPIVNPNPVPCMVYITTGNAITTIRTNSVPVFAGVPAGTSLSVRLNPNDSVQWNSVGSAPSWIWVFAGGNIV